MAAERRGRGVRVRTTVAATIVFAVAMTGASLALLTILRANLRDGLQDALDLRESEITSAILSGSLPSELTIGDIQDQVAQVLDGDGRIVAASRNVAGEAPIRSLVSPRISEIPSPVGSGRFLALTSSWASHRGAFTVIVAQSLEDVEEPLTTVKHLLMLGAPALLLVVVVTTWFVTGRALAPVEAIRREVDEISAAQLHRRVPDPSGSDEIARLARTMNRMLDRLEEAQVRQRRFVSDASHELRSPIASIRQHAEVALAHPERTTAEELAGTVLAEDLRIQRIVDDLLMLARADEGTLAMSRRPVDLDDLVFEEASRLREGPRVRVDTSGVSAGRVRGDAAGLARALRNLGDNAARHARSHVAFSLRSDGQEVVLAIEDDGDGIPAADRERVFERFVRLDDARSRDDGGTGLGLSIVSEVVRMHGGTIVARDAAIGGARLEITLPAGDEHDLPSSLR